MFVGRQDDSVGKDACHHTWRPKFNSSDPQGRRREWFSADHIVWLWHKHTRMHTYTCEHTKWILSYIHMFASVGSFTFYGLFLLYDALFISVQLILLNSYNWVHQIIYCNVFDFSSFNRQLFNIFPLYIVLWCLFLSSVWILIPANYLKIDIFCL